jgi:hypothetical protein
MNKRQRFVLISLTFLGLLAIAIAIAVQFRPHPPSPANRQDTAPSPISTPEPSSLYGPLLGRWLRTDGDYLLDVRGIEGTGKAQVAYFNPRPIHVARAEASREGELLKLMVVLEDVGYPGSSYTLIYSPIERNLAGEYYQAALQETFDVSFTRLP